MQSKLSPQRFRNPDSSVKFQNINFSKEVENIKKNTGIKVSAVIPAWNEASTIGKVIEIAVKYPYFDEVIIINDGSLDKTLEIAKSYESKHKKLSVISNTRNMGKTAAIIKGIHKAKYPLIVMLDADLISIPEIYFSKLIYYIISGQYSMTVLDRGSDRESPIGWSQSILARLLGGERALWKSDFLQMSLKGNERYGLESIMNLYYVNHNLKARSIYAPDVGSLYQFHKRGFFKGLLEYGNMFIDMFLRDKPTNLVKQTMTIEEDRLEKLYDIRKKSNNNGLLTLAILGAGLALSIQTFLYLNAKRLRKSFQPKD